MKLMDLSDPNAVNGMQTRVWGPAGWLFLHCIAQNYPMDPKKCWGKNMRQRKTEFKMFFKLVGDVLPL